MTVGSSPVRTVTTVEPVPAVGPRRPLLGWATALSAGYLLLLLSAAVPLPAAVFIVVAVAVGLLEALPPTAAAVLPWGLARIGAGPVPRSLARGLLVVLFVARDAGGAAVVLAAVAVLLLALTAAATSGLRWVVGYLRQPPVLSRNVPLAGVTVPPAPHAALVDPRPDVAAPTLLAVAGGLAAAVPTLGLVLGVLAVAGAVVVPAALAAAALRLRRSRVRERVPAAIQQHLDQLQPQVLLYFAGTPTTRYQLDLWLAPVERLGLPAAVLLRDRQVLAGLPPTGLPVVCTPYAGTLMSLDLPSARVALYPANAAENIHLLRRPGLTNVFIGHGDSDKASSANPFTRVYDEVWVAGPAGRDRYLRAGVGITPDRVVEVGRPQLAGLPTAADRTGPLLSVLYAPTWEGWGEDPFHTSLTAQGPALVGALLARPGVRVLYRPHPLTGTRSAATRRAHAEVVRLLRAAGAVGPEAAPAPPAGAPAGGDPLDRAAASGRVPEDQAPYRAASADWTAAYWAAADGRHRLLTPPAPDLHACFAVADALVADVSSVTTDWLVTDRPYAVIDPAGLPAAGFRERFPSTRAAFVLPPDLTGLDGLLAAAAGGPDPTAGGRDTVRRQLLGPPDPDGAMRAAALGAAAAARPGQPVADW